MASSELALLVRMPQTGGVAFAAASTAGPLAAAGLTAEPLFEVPARFTTEAALAGAVPREWYRLSISGAGGENPWDVAHDALARASVALAAAVPPDIIEPDLLQQWDWEVPRPAGAALAATACEFTDQVREVPWVRDQFAWHLGDAYSQLKSARQAVADEGAGPVIRVAHLDTGYDPQHSVLSSIRMAHALERNFVDADRPRDATDRGAEGVLRNPGHGTATLALLAGGRYRAQFSGYQFDDVIGGAPTVEVVPVRVGNSVVQLTTSVVAQGIDYAAELCRNEATRVHVMSMSMGGVASAAWADAVNKAYDAGIVFVAAAGNNYSTGLLGFPTRHIVYPARFRRVLAACGVMADRTPYFGLSAGTMQGNWGPDAAMSTAMAAFTPNTPWAQWGCPNLMLMNGAGTSSATPQIAAAAALYLRRYASVLFDAARYPEPWMRVEAVRQALFRSADATADQDRREKLGNGILNASRLLSVAPVPANRLVREPRDSAGWPFLNVLSSSGLTSSQANRMLQLEATQLVQKWHRRDISNPLEEAVADPDRPQDEIPQAQITAFLEAVAEHPAASRRLRERARQTLVSWGHAVRTSVPVPGPAAPLGPPTPEPDRAARLRVPRPSCRKLRGFAVDPSLATRLNTASIAEFTFRIPWERLKPGPVGEYIEVVDIDPASKKFYEPVNLDSPLLLAQDGLPPAEGIPQFHQQMVYAVTSLTIRNFEAALGRKSLWRPGRPPEGKSPKNDGHFVRRLRIYPHALREANAYYSPNKVALLFGYFDSIAVDDPEQPPDQRNLVPGSRVFTCLSHDIIAHETTHALLDGIHRRFLMPSNPDVLAFHEGFADCVAMLQHFTFPELVADQIRMTQGKLSEKENVLTQLAIQFGFATGQRTALRDATGRLNQGKWLEDAPNPAEYLSKQEPHARGRILVAAVFDAFLSIYRRRTSDLVRLATGGSGVLGQGAIHPDLVQRLAEEASRAAQHVLTMCIRALDYCPPTDITFGEYLRAIITADCDVVENDEYQYRVSFIEAFQRRGIYPRDVRSLSVESLQWNNIHEEHCAPSAWLRKTVKHLRRVSVRMLYARSRYQIFKQERRLRSELHARLHEHFSKGGAEGVGDAQFLGIDPKQRFEIHSARIAFRPRPDGGIRPQLLIGILQRTQVPVDLQDTDGAKMDFEGGCVIVGDLDTGRIRYCIRKGFESATRLARQREFAVREFESLRETYLGRRSLSQQDLKQSALDEPFALVHRCH